MANQQLLIRLRDLHEELAGMNSQLNDVSKLDDETIDALGQIGTAAAPAVPGILNALQMAED